MFKQNLVLTDIRQEAWLVIIYSTRECTKTTWIMVLN